MSRKRASTTAYAEGYAALDVGRRVLQCKTCEAREIWSDVARAVVLGWGYRDEVVAGRRVRFWFCPEHRPADPFVPAYGWQVQGTSPRVDSSGPFGGRRVVIATFGASKTRIAVVLEMTDAGAKVAPWSGGPRTWRKPQEIPLVKIVGTAAPNDRRVASALAAWPPEYLAKRVRK